MYSVRCSHCTPVCSIHTFHIHKMQYAVHCNLVILHGRLFPINAAHTEHFSFSLSRFLCTFLFAQHYACVCRCFVCMKKCRSLAFIRHSKGYDFFSLLLLLLISFFFLLPSPMYSLQFVTYTNK